MKFGEEELPITTPALLLDIGKLDANLARMYAQVDRLGVPLRPHMKTAKSIDVARRALNGRPAQITVSTLSEARYFAENGITDILYAVGVTPDKLAEVRALRNEGVDLSIILDSVEMAEAVAMGGAVPTLLEIDSDGHRAGFAPDDPALVEAARALASVGPGAFRGVMTHAGGSYDCRSEEALRAAAARERLALVEAAERIQASSVPCAVRSAGSTPTALFADSAEGLTELRAGVFMFQDLVMAGLGVCAIDDIAVSVRTSVIGHQAAKEWIIVDAGWMAMSRDRGTASQPIDQGYGLVCDAAGQTISDLIMVAANQEHGILAMRPGSMATLPQLPLGTKLRILPNHACATAAQHAAYRAIGADGAELQWQRMTGW